MSPEILNDQGHEMTADWWSLGIIIYQLSTGETPFRCNGDDYEDLANQIRYNDLTFKSYFSNELKDLID